MKLVTRKLYRIIQPKNRDHSELKVNMPELPTVQEVHLTFVECDEPMRIKNCKSQYKVRHDRRIEAHIDFETLRAWWQGDTNSNWAFALGIDLTNRELYSVSERYDNPTETDNAENWDLAADYSPIDDEDVPAVIDAYIQYHANKEIAKMLGEESNEKRDSRRIPKTRRQNTANRAKTGNSKSTNSKKPKQASRNKKSGRRRTLIRA